MENPGSPTAEYYDEAWSTKLARPEYATLDRRWRSRWDFVAQRVSERAHVLDMGCGDGVLGAQLIVEKACDVSGVDVSAYALSRAAERGVHGQLCDIDMQRLPFADDTFDAAVLSCVLEHIPHPEHALLEATRVVRPGGQIFVTLPNPQTWKIRLAFLRGRFHSDLMHSKPGEGLHYRFWTWKTGLETTVRDLDLPLKLVVKRIDVKNPRRESAWHLRIHRALIRLSPGLFGEYLHFQFEKRTK